MGVVDASGETVNTQLEDKAGTQRIVNLIVVRRLRSTIIGRGTGTVNSAQQCVDDLVFHLDTAGQFHTQFGEVAIQVV